MEWQHWLTIASLVLGLLGSLYLSYDLLGGESGLLRLLLFILTWGSLISVATIGINQLIFVFGVSSSPLIKNSVTAGINSFLATSLGEAIIGYSFALAIGSLALLVNMADGIVNSSHDNDSDDKPSSTPDKASLLGNTSIAGITIIAVTLLAVLSQTLVRGFDIRYLLTNVLFYLPYSIAIIVLMQVALPYYHWLNNQKNLPDRRLGALGAAMTFIAFGVQLGLELFK